MKKNCVKNHISIKMISSITLMNDSTVLREQEAHIQTNSFCMSAHVCLCVCVCVCERERERERERETILKNVNRRISISLLEILQQFLQSPWRSRKLSQIG